MSEPKGSKNPSIEQALCALEKKKDDAAKLALTKKSEFDEISKLQKRLDALSYEERRGVLNAAGYGHISAAPSPITPIRPSYSAPSCAPQATKWEVWKFIPKVELWQAVCLTLDIEPDAERFKLADWFRYRRGTPRGLPNAFVERLQVAQANVSTNGPIHPLSLYQGVLSDPHAVVRLPEIAAFSIRCGWQIPEAMASLAKIGAETQVEAVLRPTTEVGLIETAEASQNCSIQLSPAQLRAKLDITTVRGARRRVLEVWGDIEKEYGPSIDARIVLRVLTRDKKAEAPELKTVQNLLIDLRRDGLIP